MDQLSSDLASLRIDRSTPRHRRGFGLVLVWLAGAGLVLFAARTLYGYAQTHLYKPQVTTTEVSRLTVGQPQVELTATGIVAAEVVAKVGSKRYGRIARVFVREGQAVKAGDVLFELDPTDEKSALTSAAARTNAAQARAEAVKARQAETRVKYDREKRLADSGALARSGVDDLAAQLLSLESEAKASEAEIKVSQAEAGSIYQTLKQNTIVAPIDGTAVTRPAQTGDVAVPEIPLVELVDFKSLVVEVDVPEAKLDRVRDNGPCEVVLDSAPSRRLRGEVAAISPRLDRAKATATVKVRITDTFDRVWPNMSARVSLLSAPLDEKQLAAPPVTIVPKTALAERNGTRGVFVLDGDVARFTPVTTGEILTTSVVVKSGPLPGTKLVDKPSADLSTGRTVKTETP